MSTTTNFKRIALVAVAALGMGVLSSVPSQATFQGVAGSRVTVTADTAACEGTELSTPIPNAATATSATRLKFVVVDICFLSLVVTRNFLVAASR